VPHDFLYDLAISLMVHRPLLWEFNNLKDEFTRKVMNYRKHVITKDGTI